MLNSLISLNKIYQQNPEQVLFVEGDIKLTAKKFASNMMAYIKQHHHEKKIIGIFGNNSIDWAIAECGLSATNNIFVPLPRFFSDEQLKAVIINSKLNLIYTDKTNFDRIKKLFNKTLLFLKNNKDTFVMPLNNIHKRIIYTSGTTGSSKGVIQTDIQINFIVKLLINHFKVTKEDVYFSLLPISTLLEQITSIHSVLETSSKTIFDPKISNQIFNLKNSFIKKVITQKTSILCLTPALLETLINFYEMFPFYLIGIRLKAITVGGSKCSLNLLERAKKLNLPVFEGYGLSEACSVVAVNDLDKPKLGSVGKPLPGVAVKIIKNEIVIHSESLMEGYLGSKKELNNKFYTGDVGFIDKQGYLTVTGRKDEIIALKNGRSINPSWIEQLITKSLKIDEAYVFCNNEGKLAIAVKNYSNNNFKNLKKNIDLVVPEYARPERIYFINSIFLKKNKLLNSNGKVIKQKLYQTLNSNIYIERQK